MFDTEHTKHQANKGISFNPVLVLFQAINIIVVIAFCAHLYYRSWKDFELSFLLFIEQCTYTYFCALDPSER